MPGGQADFRLMSVTQKGNQLQIIGTSLNQQIVADFLKQLEFSNGLFSNLTLNIEGKEVKPEDAGDKKSDSDEMVRVYLFKIDCTYNKPRAEGDTKPEQK